MAQPHIVFRALNTVAGAFNWSPDRTDRQRETWMRFLADIPDEALLLAVDQWIQHEPKAPTINDIIRATSSERPEGPTGCEACGYTGWRHLEWTRNTIAGNETRTYCAPCDCAKGQRMRKNPGVLGYQEAIAAFRRDPSTAGVVCSGVPFESDVSVQESDGFDHYRD